MEDSRRNIRNSKLLKKALKHTRNSSTVIQPASKLKANKRFQLLSKPLSLSSSCDFRHRSWQMAKHERQMNVACESWSVWMKRQRRYKRVSVSKTKLARFLLFARPGRSREMTSSVSTTMRAHHITFANHSCDHRVSDSWCHWLWGHRRNTRVHTNAHEW